MTDRKPRDLATAHQAWEERWRDEAGRADWLDPAPEVRELAPELRPRGVARVLDLGSGVGRHALYLAALGFRVAAVDASPAGLDYAGRAAEAAGLEIAFHRAEMTDLPFAEASFDYLLSWNVIYHGDGAVAARVLAEAARVLSPRGLLQITLLSKRHRLYGQGTEIAPDTFVFDDDTDTDKAHPHFYCDAAGARDLIAPWFDVVALDEAIAGDKPGAAHLHLVAERRAAG